MAMYLCCLAPLPPGKCTYADETAAQLDPKQLGQLNKELSTLQPVVDALSILARQRQEVRHALWMLLTTVKPAL